MVLCDNFSFLDLLCQFGNDVWRANIYIIQELGKVLFYFSWPWLCLIQHCINSLGSRERSPMISCNLGQLLQLLQAEESGRIDERMLLQILRSQTKEWNNSIWILAENQIITSLMPILKVGRTLIKRRVWPNCFENKHFWRIPVHFKQLNLWQRFKPAPHVGGLVRC